MGWLCALYVAHALTLVAIAWRHVRRPAEALTWLLLGLVLPGLGPALYAWMARPLRTGRGPASAQGTGHVPRGNRAPQASSAGAAERGEKQPSAGAAETAKSTGSAATDAPPLGRAARAVATAIERLTGAPPLPAQVQVLCNGTETYDHLLRALRSAERTIDLDYYIYRDDHVGRLISDVLIARAEAGVRIRFLRDGVGSRSYPRAAAERLAAAGIACRVFFPLRFPWVDARLNHRDHCKIAIIDGQEAFVGGINVGDEYTGRKPGVGWWRDTHLRLRGEAVSQLQAAFEANWALADPDRAARAHGWRNPADAAAECDGPRGADSATGGATGRRARPRPWRPAMSPAGRMWNVEFGPDPLDDADVSEPPLPARAQTVAGRPDAPVQAVRDLYFLCITQAERRVDITTPYFVPDSDILAALKTAAMRGVRVRLLVPRRCDHVVVGMASRTFYRDLLQAGVEIYLYEPGVLHAKVMQVDDEIGIVGAANYDLRSFRLSYEVCQVMYSRPVAAELTRQFERDLQHSTRLVIAELDAQPRWQAALHQAARLLAPLL
ncbi:phospholipase D-like domain-containing protein [Alicyclobacillus macrosporangiidus]|uniref:Phosphatidylserine/phosphatidylglycerophosphate/cardiolipin synthase n=1 Tax=Alicyclobacillus macrosporangiidus TaxID=392015 RepID=A0A1I7GGV2_9BACL|nr:phospholipase D-like domain-containing protein [Alicyclobacillus macrosporangiidus]SFU47722.1 Phosphatidylserine/phosphatidylglycerophosphate/cardiolipin synthase [Alicyclobacillus macrosporangiidus]